MKKMTLNNEVVEQDESAILPQQLETVKEEAPQKKSRKPHLG